MAEVSNINGYDIKDKKAREMLENINLGAIENFTEALNSKVDKENGKSLSSNDFTDDDKSKLDGVETNANKNLIEKIIVNDIERPINDKTVNIKIPTSLSDLEGSEDFVTQKDLESKVDTEDGKGLSTNDYTNNDKNKLKDIEPKAQVNVIENLRVNGEVQSIQDKVVDISIPRAISDLDGSEAIPTKSEVDKKVDKQDGKGLSSNDYTNEDKQKLANINEDAEANIIEKIHVNSVELGVTDKVVNITVPTKTSELDNDSGYVDADTLNGKLPTKTSDLQNDSGYLTAKRYTNVLVPISAFTENGTFEDYPYKADIAIDGVTVKDYANISFALSDVASKNYAPICTTDNGIVSIYAVEVPPADITIPLIEVVKI